MFEPPYWARRMASAELCGAPGLTREGRVPIVGEAIDGTFGRAAVYFFCSALNCPGNARSL
jgi:hypothetical protein